MKIKSIAAICKKNKNIAIFERYSDDGDILTQYIGDGSAVYPVIGLPPLDAESLLTIFDVPEKDRDNYFVKTLGVPAGISFEDTDATERQVEREGISIIYSGRTLKPIRTTRGLVFIESRPYDPENPNARCSAQSKKPEGIAAELADVIIRVLDYCAYAGIDIENVLEVKHEYNKSRPYRHGGKKC